MFTLLPRDVACQQLRPGNWRRTLISHSANESTVFFPWKYHINSYSVWSNCKLRSVWERMNYRILFQSWSENISVSFCPRVPGYGLTLWCALGLLVGSAIQVPQLQLQLQFQSAATKIWNWSKGNNLRSQKLKNVFIVTFTSRRGKSWLKIACPYDTIHKYLACAKKLADNARSKLTKLGQRGREWVTWPTFKILGPLHISERFELETTNLACRLITKGTNHINWKLGQRGSRRCHVT